LQIWQRRRLPNWRAACCAAHGIYLDYNTEIIADTSAYTDSNSIVYLSLNLRKLLHANTYKIVAILLRDTIAKTSTTVWARAREPCNNTCDGGPCTFKTTFGHEQESNNDGDDFTMLDRLVVERAQAKERTPNMLEYQRQ
jgi:hypothetical protein